MIRLNRWMTGLAVLAAMALAMAMALGGVLYAQSAGADIPLLGKLQKGFHDPNGGLLDAWNVDYEAGAALPAGVRSTETVFHHLETLAASSGTHVAAGGTFPSNNVDGTIFLANAHFTVGAGIAQDIARWRHNPDTAGRHLPLQRGQQPLDRDQRLWFHSRRHHLGADAQDSGQPGSGRMCELGRRGSRVEHLRDGRDCGGRWLHNHRQAP